MNETGRFLILRNADLQPHRSRYWKTPTLNDEFRKRASRILWCYENVGKLDPNEDIDGDGKLDGPENIDPDGDRLPNHRDPDPNDPNSDSEDDNGNGRLDPGEDANGNGALDGDRCRDGDEDAYKFSEDHDSVDWPDDITDNVIK